MSLSVPDPVAPSKTPVPPLTANVVSIFPGFPNDFCAPGAKDEFPGKHTVPTSSSSNVLPSEPSVIVRTALRSAQFVSPIGAKSVISKVLVAAP